MNFLHLVAEGNARVHSAFGNVLIYEHLHSTIIFVCRQYVMII